MNSKIIFGHGSPADDTPTVTEASAVAKAMAGQVGGQAGLRGYYDRRQESEYSHRRLKAMAAKEDRSQESEFSRID